MITSNAIHQIDAYKVGNTWYFDDLGRNIRKEAFVLGASELIDNLIIKVIGEPNRTKVSVLFSETFIKEHDAHLILVDCDYPYKWTGKFNNVTTKKGTFRVRETVEDTSKPPISGTYIEQATNHQCWLCPAQLKFFGKVADQIFVKVLN